MMQEPQMSYCKGEDVHPLYPSSVHDAVHRAYILCLKETDMKNIFCNEIEKALSSLEIRLTPDELEVAVKAVWKAIVNKPTLGNAVKPISQAVNA